MSATSTTDRSRSLRLPSQDEHAEMRVPRPLRYLIIAANAVVVGLLGLLLVIASPFIALGTGFWGVLTDIRDTALRPRPFVGARHGFPFLDPPKAAPQPQAEEAEET
jgi:hypothetical protein